MARRNANLAGLAALGALGYALRDKGGKNMAPVEDRMVSRASKDDEDFAAMDASMATMRPQRGYVGSEEIVAEDGTPSSMRRNLETGELYSTTGISAPTGGRGTASTPVRRAPAPKATPTPAAAPQSTSRATTLDERVSQIPTSGYRKVEGGERIDSSEAGRNISNALNATSGLTLPGYILKGFKAGAPRIPEYIQPTIGYADRKLLGQGASTAEKAAANRASREAGRTAEMQAANARATARGEARAAREAAREAEKQEFNRRGVDRFVESTFEGGMKKGGKVKKASGGMARSSASKRGDGIATKGKTKGKIY